ncbi:MAG: pyruvate formate lyase family protein [Myxococcota bacterium]|nr:pyruvate formate lyase family protein [Myxococcota bacterium]
MAATALLSQQSDGNEAAAEQGEGTAAPVRSERLSRLREALLNAPYSLCTQKAELITDFYRGELRSDPWGDRLARIHFALFRRGLARNLGEGEPQSRWQLSLNRTLQRLYARRQAARQQQAPIVTWARALAHVLERVPLQIYPDELIVGNPSSQRIGAPIHPDLGGLLMLPELTGLAARKVNPLATTPEQVRLLEEEILPFWFSRSVQSRAGMLAEDLELPNELVRGRHFVLTQFAGISHVTPDHRSVLERGFRGILDDVRQRRREQTTDPEQAAFYDAAEITAQAAIAFARRWSDHCRREAECEPDGERASELKQLAEVLERVPALPARNFHEALQSIFLTHTMLHQESFQHGISFGRLDQLLWPFYQRDVAAGTLTRERAVELLGCFLGKAAELLPLFNAMATEYFSGLSSASGITLGGTDDAGRDASNEVSFLLLEAYGQLRLRQPNLHLRVHPASDPSLVSRACELVKQGGGMPAFFNDARIVPALEDLDVAAGHARDYSIVGCVEWGIPGRSFPAAGAAFLSLPAAFDRALHGGSHADEGGRPRKFESMEALVDAFREEVERLVAAAVRGNDAIESAHAMYRPTPLLSTVVDGCLEHGRDVNAGGARYDSTGMQGVGAADVADSLAAIERIVFDERRMSLDAFISAVDRDFDGAREIEHRATDRTQKFGQDAGGPEGWARRVVDIYCAAVRRHSNPRGGPYAPGFWTMTTHVGFGRRLGALPSGRRAGLPLADGLSPVNGCDDAGPTASLRAAAAASTEMIGNGLCLNEKLDPWYLRGEAGTKLLADLTRGYFDAGGMQVQYNVVDASVLIDARRHPERHRDLVVRISGYSAYFNDLTDEMKEELITRTLHASPHDRGPACQQTEGEGRV